MSNPGGLLRSEIQKSAGCGNTLMTVRVITAVPYTRGAAMDGALNCCTSQRAGLSTHGPQPGRNFQTLDGTWAPHSMRSQLKYPL